jgi:hypothetical protein
VEDGEVAIGEFGQGLDAVFGAGAEGVEPAEGLKGECDGGLEGGYAHDLPDFSFRVLGLGYGHDE